METAFLSNAVPRINCMICAARQSGGLRVKRRFLEYTVKVGARIRAPFFDGFFLLICIIWVFNLRHAVSNHFLLGKFIYEIKTDII